VQVARRESIMDYLVWGLLIVGAGLLLRWRHSQPSFRLEHGLQAIDAGPLALMPSNRPKVPEYDSEVLLVNDHMHLYYARTEKKGKVAETIDFLTTYATGGICVTYVESRVVEYTHNGITHRFPILPAEYDRLLYRVLEAAREGARSGRAYPHTTWPPPSETS
jgi:hypothetical protein